MNPVMTEINGIRVYDDSIFKGFIDFDVLEDGDFVIKNDGIYIVHEGKLDFFASLEKLIGFIDCLKSGRMKPWRNDNDE